jgi:antitoxin HicB
MKFPVILTPDTEAGGFVVTFPDIPEAITQGETEAEALAMAQEALETALEFCFEDKRAVPAPAKPKRGQRVVELPASLSAKVLLLNEMVTQGVRPAELARRLGTTPQEINRLTNLRHTTRIDGIAAALRALGRGLEMRLAHTPR